MDRFRDLERTGNSGRKDASLLAAIAGFEALRQPTSQDSRQFSNLFLGLFPHTGDDTKRTAAAALSRLAVLPDDVAAEIASQPVRIAAPFLAFSDCASDRILLQVITRHGVGHGRAISRRKTLSEPVITALLSLDDEAVVRSLKVRGLTRPVNESSDFVSEPSLRQQNEEALRNRLKDLALEKRNAPKTILQSGRTDMLGKLLTLQARGRNPVRFAQCLALALKSDPVLTDRIMLDISGHQLAMALQALDIAESDTLAILESVFTHLTRMSNGVAHSKLLLDGCDPDESMRKVDAWRRANANTDGRKPEHQPLTTDLPTRAANLPADRRTISTERRGRGVKIHARRA